jgi:hypothetical protein
VTEERRSIGEVIRAATRRDPAEPRPQPPWPERKPNPERDSADRMDDTWLRTHGATGTVLAAEPTPRIADAGLTGSRRIEAPPWEVQDRRPVIIINGPST